MDGPAVTLPLLYISTIPLEYTWRIILALGALPGLGLLYSQWQLHRSKHQRQEQEDVPQQLNRQQDDNDDHDDDDNQQGDAENIHLIEGMPSSPRSNHHCGGGGGGGVHGSENLPGNLSSNNARETMTRGNCAGGGDVDHVAVLCEDSDGEVGTFLDSSPDLSSGDGCYGASEPPAIRHGWWASIVMEERLCQKLLGTAVTWFLFDLLFYGNTIFQAIVVEATFRSRENKDGNDASSNNSSSDRRHLLQRTALDSFILTSIALPGYAVAGALIGRRICGVTQSVRFVMLQGLGCMSVLYFTIGWYWKELRMYSPSALVVLYGLTFFFANYGPNTTTFVLPALVYSPECRSTWNGFSAAAGKLGALCGATLFAPAAQAWGDATVMLLCSMIGAMAFLITLGFVHIPPPKENQGQQLPPQEPEGPEQAISTANGETVEGVDVLDQQPQQTTSQDDPLSHDDPEEQVTRKETTTTTTP